MTERRSFTSTRAPDLTRGTDWRDQARCVGSEHIYDLAADHPNDEQIVRAALTICADCPVAEICGRELMDLEHGVVGGLTEQERRRIRRAKPAAPGPNTCPDCGREFANYGRLSSHLRFHAPTCKRGHVIAEVGRDADRMCRQCRREDGRARRARKDAS